uniref:Lon proteolytic domain-containing protein n=1 Tax=Meloidogyne hapla TaxID=6305 RepID=A0A1I8AZ63_MELHA
MSKKSVQVEVECIKNRHQEFKEIKFSSTRHFYGCFNDPCTTWGPSCNFQLIVFIFFLLFDQVSASTSNDSLIFTFGILLCVLVMIFLFIVCYFLTFRLKPSTCKQNNQRQRTIYHDEEMAIDKTQSSLEIEHIDENIDENMPESNLQIETEEPNVELKLFDYEKAEYYENENSSSGSDVEDKELRVGMCTCRDAAVSYDMDDSISEFKTYLMKDGVRIKSAYFANESKESGNLNKDLPIGVFPLLAVGASGGKYHGVVHSVSVGVSSQPIAEQFFAPGAPEDLRASAFDALSFSEKFCRDNGIEFTKYEKDCYFYEFDPPQDDRKGPSAGIPLTIATLSKITNKLPDKDLCSTGQIRITGLMLSVDGLKFKVRAAKAVGKTKILLPKEMESKYNKLKEKDKNGMTAIFAEYFDINTYNEVFQIVPVTPSPQVNDIN